MKHSNPPSTLHRKKGSAFEDYVADVLRISGHSVVCRDTRFGFEVDVYAEKPGAVTIVQCKDFEKLVNYDKLSSWVSASLAMLSVNKVHEAIIVARKGFTDACRRSVEVASEGRIALFNLPEFEDQFLGFRSLRGHTLNRIDRVEADLAMGGALGTFLPLTCARGDARTSQNVETVLDNWLQDSNSNVLLLMGPFGSGKTASAIRLAKKLIESFGQQHWRTPIYLDFRELSGFPEQIESENSLLATALKRQQGLGVALDSGYLLGAEAQRRLLIIVDGYDEAALSGSDSPGSPDIRKLSSLFYHDSKVLIACRRSHADSDERLLVDIASPAIGSALGIRNPVVITIEPWSEEIISSAVDSLPLNVSRSLGRYIASSKAEYLRRPLLFRMLAQLHKEDSSHEDFVSVGQLYDSYFRLILTREWASGGSSIPFDVKQTILTGIAEDLFKRPPAEESGLPVRASFGVTRNQIELRVVQAVSDYHARVNATSRLASGFPWTSDFLRTSHVVSLVSGGFEAQELRYHFVHRSFYEYFLAQHLLRNIDRSGTLGLKGRDVHDIQDLFDSLVLYFVKHGLGVERMAKLYRLGMSRQVDRVELGVLIYLLEDHPGLKEIISALPSDYTDFIGQWERATESHFLKKMYRYQIALITEDPEHAYAYVDYLRSRETNEEEDLELRLFSVGTEPADYLLRRLLNPNLVAVRPITIYRLAKFGDVQAVQVLGKLRSTSEERGDRRLTEVINQAVDAIEKRAVKSSRVLTSGKALGRRKSLG